MHIKLNNNKNNDKWTIDMIKCQSVNREQPTEMIQLIYGQTKRVETPQLPTNSRRNEPYPTNQFQRPLNEGKQLIN